MLWSRRPMHVWALHVFMDRRVCYRHYADYTFTVRLGWPKALAKVVVYPFPFIVTGLLRSASAIAVHRGSLRIRETFNQSMEALLRGESVAIFPDIDYSDKNSDIGEIYEGFLQLERAYRQTTGKHLPFVPMSVSREKRLLRIGRPVYFTGDMPFPKEKSLISSEICKAINNLNRADD